MELWDSWCKTDPGITKNFTGKGGFKGTAICAQHQIRLATEQWGPMGKHWGVKDESFTRFFVEEDANNALPPIRKLSYQAALFYPSGVICVCSDIDLYVWSSTYKRWGVNNDIMKKVKTDALTKGLSQLGMNSDVFEGKFDDNKYVQQMRDDLKESQSRPSAAAPPTSVRRSDTKEVII